VSDLTIITNVPNSQYEQQRIEHFYIRQALEVFSSSGFVFKNLWVGTSVQCL